MLLACRKIIPLILLLSSTGLSHAGEGNWGAGVEYFYWREYVDSCPRSLEEMGPRFFTGYDYVSSDYQNWDLGFQGRLYGAVVVYDGFSQSCTPLAARTNYIGASGELSATRWLIGASAINGRPDIGLMAGLGFDRWRRTIVATGGYSEDYLIGYIRLGLAAKQNNHWSLHAGVKHPFSIYEVAHLSEAGFSSDPELQPRAALGYFADIRYRQSEKYTIEIYCDSYRFGRSNDVTVSSCPPSYTTCAIHQPTSHQYTVGFRVIINQ